MTHGNNLVSPSFFEFSPTDSFVPWVGLDGSHVPPRLFEKYPSLVLVSKHEFIWRGSVIQFLQSNTKSLFFCHSIQTVPHHPSIIDR
jgi:hypothetical protein